MGVQLKLPLSNAQLELLKVFSENLPEKEILELKKILTEWRFKKLKEAANEVWEKNNWTAEYMEELRKTHLRTLYQSQNEFLKKETKN